MILGKNLWTYYNFCGPPLSNLYATGWCTFILSEIFLFIKLSICSYKQGLKDAPTPQILFVADRFCPMVNSFLKFGACCNAVGSAPPETNNCCRSFSSFSSATQTFLVNRRQDPLTPVEDFAFGKKGDWVKETQAQPIFFLSDQSPIIALCVYPHWKAALRNFG